MEVFFFDHILTWRGKGRPCSERPTVHFSLNSASD